MAKFKVNRNNRPKEKLKNEAKKVNWRLHLATLISTLMIFGIYQICIYLEQGFVIHVYAALLLILSLIYFIMNRGFSNKKLTADDIPDEAGENKAEYAHKINLQRKKAKLLLIPIIGILFTFAFDIVYLFYIEPIL